MFLHPQPTVIYMKRLSSTFENENGFTLIELVVAMLVLALIAGIAVPVFTKWVPNYRLRSAASDLYSNMQLARMRAIRSGGDYGIVFDVGAGSYDLVDSGDGDFATAGDNNVEESVILADYGSNIRYGSGSAGVGDNLTYTDDRAVFTSRGTTLGMGTVYLDNNRNDRAYAVSTTIAGAVRLRRWKNGTWD
jgi:prepilin-type N-terminal cleavage/methylation domain-containing protein